MVGGSQLAIDVYKDEHGLNIVQDEIVEEQQPEIEANLRFLITRYPRTYILRQSWKRRGEVEYLFLLALCFESSESLKALAREFIALLAEKSGFPECRKK